MVSFFGLIVHLDPSTTVVVFCALVVTLLLFEHALEKIEHMAKDADFSELVKKLYKEMMIMGFIGFFIFILFNAFTLEHDENYLAFEFAHITIFFIGIILVFRAIFVVISSNRATAGFWRAHNQKCSTILERYLRVQQNWWSLEAICFKYFPFWSGLYADIEYKTMEDFFHTDFNMSRYEFSFVHYLTMSNKFYAIEKVELSYLSWFFLIVLAVLNYIRNVLTRGKGCRSHISDDHHDDDHDDHTRRILATGDDGADFIVSERCANYNTYYFMIAGSALMLFGLFICFITWRSKIKLLHIAGIEEPDDYESILTDVMTREQDTILALALKHEDMENSINDKAHNSDRRGVLKTLGTASTRHLEEENASWHVITLRKVIEENKKMKDEAKKKQQEEMKQHLLRIFRMFKVTKCITWLLHNPHSQKGLERIQKLVKKRREIGSKQKIITPVRRLSSVAVPSMLAGSPAISPSSPLTNCTSPPPHNSSQPDENLSVKSTSEENIHPLMYELDVIFIKESRRLFNTIFEIFQMLCALYLSLYLTNFLFIAFETQNATWNTLFSVLSIIILLVIMSFTQFHSNILLSVTSLQNDAAEWICHQDEIKNRTLPRLREELINVVSKDNFVQEIRDLYDLVNENGDEGIDMKEFHNLLFTLNIQLTDEEMHCLFRVLNITGTGLIGFQELKELLRPNSSFLSIEVEKSTRREVHDADAVCNKRETLLNLSSTFSTEHSLKLGRHPVSSSPDNCVQDFDRLSSSSKKYSVGNNSINTHLSDCDEEDNEAHERRRFPKASSAAVHPI